MSDPRTLKQRLHAQESINIAFVTLQMSEPELAEKLGQSETRGVVVVQIDNNTPAAEAGVRPLDIILEVDQVPVENLDQFNRKIGAYKERDTILFLIKRGDATLYLTVKVWK